MSEVWITLPRYSRSWHWPRDRILSIIPESLIGQALQEEPDVPEITLRNSEVTPEAMDVVEQVLQGYEPKHHSPNLSSSAKYLNIPWLIYYEDPLYDAIEKGPYDTPSNRTLLENAARTDHNVIMGYLLLKGVSPIQKEPEKLLPGMRTSWGSLLPEKIIPERLWSPPLNAALQNDNLQAFQILMAIPEIKQSYPIETILESINMMLPYKIFNGYISTMTPPSNILDYILRTSPAEFFETIEEKGLFKFVSNLEIIQRIYPFATTQEQRDVLIRMAISSQYNDVVFWLLQQPGNTNYKVYLTTAIEWSNSADLVNYLFDHVPNLTRLEYEELYILAGINNDFTEPIVRSKLDARGRR